MFLTDINPNLIVHPKPITEYVKYVNPIILETNDHCLIGQIETTKVDPLTKHYFILDKKTNIGVFEFNKDGKFVRQYGSIGEGPGAYQNIRDFSIGPRSEIFIASSYKLLLFNKFGKLIKEKKISFVPLSSATLNDTYVVSTLFFPNQAQSKSKELVSFDNSLEQVKSFENSLAIKDSIRISPRKNLVSLNNYIYYSLLYFPNLIAYDKNGLLQERIHFSENLTPYTLDDLKKPFNKQRISEFNKDNFSFYKMFKCGRGVYFEDMIRHDNLNHVSSKLYIPSKKQINVYPSYYDRMKSGTLKIEGIVGGYDEGLIGFIESQEMFIKLQNDCDLLKGVTYNPTDNPILIHMAL